MANKLKELLSQPLPQNNSSHATLIAVIGGYLIYMAYEMVQSTLTGKSSMSMTVTVITALIMALAGLGTIGYGVYLWRAASKQQEEPLQDVQEDETQ